MDVLATAIFGVVKAAVFVCDIVTLPIHWLFTDRKRSYITKRLKAISISKNPAGPYRSIDQTTHLSKTLIPGCHTPSDLFERAVDNYSNKYCLGTRVCLVEMDEVQDTGKVFKKAIYGDYQWETYSQVSERVTNFGRGLASNGLKESDVFVIFAETCADWMVVAEAGFKYNFPFCTLYATLGDDSLVHMVNEVKAEIIVTTAELLPKFLSLLERMPVVSQIIYMDKHRSPPPDLEFPPRISVKSMTAVENTGKEFPEPTSRPQPDDLAVIMYTSGSTSFPKGVMLSHRNIMAGVAGLCDRIIDLGPEDTYIAYLPLAHVLELAAEVSCLALGINIGYSSPQTITDQSTRIKSGCQGDISVLKPSVMTSVPLVLDRIYKGVWDKVNRSSPFARSFFRFAYKYKEFWMVYGFNTPLLDRIVFNKIRQLLGGRIRHMVAGSAPLNHATQRFINTAFCMTMGQGYGLTETFGAGAVAEAYDNHTQHVGHPLICCQILLKNWEDGGYRSTDLPNPRGEVLIGGDNVAVGYYKNATKTAEDFVTIDGIRYFCTGDIGEIHPDGTLSIIDRKKDLVKLQAGEYVSLGKVETIMKLCPLVEQICMYADSQQNFAICFVVPNVKSIRKLAQTIGIDNGTLPDLCSRKDVEKLVLEQLHVYAKKAKLARFEIPAKVKLCPEPWTSELGLLTEAFKLKRNKISEYYASSISSMYS